MARVSSLLQYCCTSVLSPSAQQHYLLVLSKREGTRRLDHQPRSALPSAVLQDKTMFAVWRLGRKSKQDCARIRASVTLYLAFLHGDERSFGEL